MFRRDALERAAKTFAQAFVATLAISVTVPGDVGNLDAWKAMGLAALIAAVSAGLSAVSSVASRRVGDPDTASLVAPPVVSPAHPVWSPPVAPLEVGPVAAAVPVRPDGIVLTFDA